MSGRTANPEQLSPVDMRERGEHFEVQQIGASTAAFDQVVSLHAGNSKTLGMFPKGAFEECAQKGWLLGAVDEDGLLHGYRSYGAGSTGTVA